MTKQPQIPHRPMIARSCPSSSIAHDRRGRGRNRFLKWFSVAAVLLTSGHALYAQGAADALFIDEKGNLTIGTTTFIYQSGNVGIGTPSPESSLHVATDKSVRFELGKSQKLSLGGNGSFEVDAPGKVGGRFMVTDSGMVGIGTTKPNTTLDVRGATSVNNLSFTDVDGNPQPNSWIGITDNNVNGSGKTPWLHIGGITDERKKENEKTGSVDGDGKRRIALYANTTYVSDGLIVENAITAKSINGEKPPLVFEVGVKGDVTKWYAVDQDIGPLCGDADGCTMRFNFRVNSTDQVRTISEQMYIEQPDKSSNKSLGLHGWTRQLGGGESEFVLQTSNKYDLVPHPWDWIFVRNYSSPEAGTQSSAYSGYKVQFMTRPNVAATVIIYDR